MPGPNATPTDATMRKRSRHPSPARRRVQPHAPQGTMKLLFFITLAVVLAKMVVPRFTESFALLQMRTPSDLEAIQKLQAAVTAFRLEQLGLPVPPEWLDETEAHPTEGAWLDAVLGKRGDLNPRGVSYVSFPAAVDGKGGIVEIPQRGSRLLDSQGRPFLALFDLNGDGKVLNPDPEERRAQPEISAAVVIFGSGVDGRAETWGDNVKSWYWQGWPAANVRAGDRAVTNQGFARGFRWAKLHALPDVPPSRSPSPARSWRAGRLWSGLTHVSPQKGGAADRGDGGSGRVPC